MKRRPESDRFWEKVDIRSPDCCWEWIAAKRKGYGAFRLCVGMVVDAHRFAYEALVGPISEATEIDHLCRNRTCVNPAHLEPVSHRENTRRGVSPSGINARKTHCDRGHEFTAESTRIEPSGRRRCRICQNISKGLNRQRKETSK